MPWGIVIGASDSSISSDLRSKIDHDREYKEYEIRKIEKEMRIQISIIRESVEHYMTILQKDCDETIQRIEKEATDKIEQIKNKK